MSLLLQVSGGVGQVAAALGQVAAALGQVAVTVVGARALGRRLCASTWRFPHPALDAAAHTAVGLLIVSHAILVMAAAQVARPTTFGILLAVLLGLAALEIGPAWRQVRRCPWPHGWSIAAAASVWAAWIVLAALLPPTGIDELTYHLEVPRRILEHGGLLLFVDNIRAYFPQLGEMLFLYGMAIGGELAAKLFHGVFGGLIALAIYGASSSTARSSEPSSSASASEAPTPEASGPEASSSEASSSGPPRLTALLVSALFLSVPSVMVVASWAYVDLHFTLYGFLALLALLRHLEAEGSRWAWLAGLLAGGAWATKYTGMQLTLLLVLLLLIEHLRSRKERAPVAAVIVPAVSFAVFAPYAVRNWLQTGWPLYPFHVGPFSLAPAMNWGPDRSALLMDWLWGFGSGGSDSFLSVLLAPVLVFVRAGFGEIQAYDGFIGPVFLLVPLLLWRGPRSDRVRRLGIFAVAFIAYWTITTRQVRFFLPVLPVLCVLLAVGLSRWRDRPAAAEERTGRGRSPRQPSRSQLPGNQPPGNQPPGNQPSRVSPPRHWASWLLSGLVAASIVVHLGIGAHQVLQHDPWRYWSGRESRDEYLARRVSGFPLYQVANRTLGPDDLVFLVNMRNFGYLLDCRWRADFVFQHYTLGETLRAAGSIDDIAAYFRQRRATHLMIDEEMTRSGLGRRQWQMLARFIDERAELVSRNPRQLGQSLWRLSTGAGTPGASAGRRGATR